MFQSTVKRFLRSIASYILLTVMEEPMQLGGILRQLSVQGKNKCYHSNNLVVLVFGCYGNSIPPIGSYLESASTPIRVNTLKTRELEWVESLLSVAKNIQFIPYEQNGSVLLWVCLHLLAFGGCGNTVVLKIKNKMKHLPVTSKKLFILYPSEYWSSWSC